MKLLRLTTTDSNAIFDATFNENLVIPKGSQIALQNISIEGETQGLVLDLQNNQIYYTVSPAGEQTIDLDQGTFDSTNINTLLTDINNKLNQSSGFSFLLQNQRELGIEWKAQVGKSKKVEIGYGLGNYVIDTRDNWNYEATDVQRVGTGFWSRVQATDTAGYESNMAYPGFISRGCGFTRARIYTLENTTPSNVNTSGMVLALTTAQIPNDELALEDIKYGIWCTITTTGLRYYRVIVDGVVGSNSGVNIDYFGDTNSNNDVVEILINNGNVEFLCYKATDAGEKTVIDSVPYNPEFSGDLQKLYPVNIFHGKRADARFTLVRLTESPYDENGDKVQQLDIVEDNTDLFQPPRPSRGNFDNKLKFQAISLANFLGYNSLNQDTIRGVDANYIADSAFSGVVIADAFLVEMLNIPLDSYDSFVNQRKNLLAVIPASDKDGSVIYEPSTPFFINIKNDSDLLLRNIRCRLVNPDYTPFNMLGLATLTLLIS